MPDIDDFENLKKEELEIFLKAITIAFDLTDQNIELLTRSFEVGFSKGWKKRNNITNSPE